MAEIRGEGCHNDAYKATHFEDFGLKFSIKIILT